MGFNYCNEGSSDNLVDSNIMESRFGILSNKVYVILLLVVKIVDEFRIGKLPSFKVGELRGFLIES